MNNQWNLNLVPKNLSCIWCDMKFSNLTDVEFHTRAHHPYHCNECLKELPTWKAYLNHAKHCFMSKKNLSYHYKKYKFAQEFLLQQPK
jgi:hypothetical protein